MSRHLYSVTLQKPTSITHTALGNFSGEKRAQELVVCRGGGYLELFKLDANNGQLSLILSHNCFAIVRQVQAFKVSGTGKDRLIVTSDAGTLCVLEYKSDKNRFVELYAEPYGKSGVRRTIPGQYLATDPRGRCVLTAAVERSKLVYLLSRDAESNNVVISSPLEAHTPHSLVYQMIGLDTGFDNPIFASLEVDYREFEKNNNQQKQKRLVFYELDLGLNHVVRKWSTVVDPDANLLLSCPGYSRTKAGPSGVLVCTKNWIYYYNQQQEPIKVVIPRRAKHLDATVTFGVYDWQGDNLFYLLQTDSGDVFKMNLELSQDMTGVVGIQIKFFQTLPRCNSFCIFKAGFLFCALESGNHQLYQFWDLGDDDDTPVFRSKQEDEKFHFDWIQTENLGYMSSIHSLDSLMGLDIANLTSDETPQIHTISGQGAQSTFRTLKYGLPVEQRGNSKLKSNPLGVHAVKSRHGDEQHTFVVLSYAQSSQVYKFERGMAPAPDSGILTNVRTLAIEQVGNEGILQVHVHGMVHITTDNTEKWAPAEGEFIVHASVNRFQAAIALNTGQVVYFEIDEDGGGLCEYGSRLDIQGGVSSLSVGEIPPGRIRSPFMAVGCSENSLRIVSLEPGSILEVMTIQMLTAEPYSVLVCFMRSVDDDNNNSGGDAAPAKPMLHVGLANGVYISSQLDPIAGQLSDTRTRFLGPQPLKLHKVKVGRQAVDAILALSTKCWLGYSTAASSFDMTPVDLPALKSCCWLEWPGLTQVVMGIEPNGASESSLVFFKVPDLSDKLRQTEVALAHTPRRVTRLTNGRCYYVVESDYNCELESYTREPGSWASCIESVDPLTNQVAGQLKLERNAAAFSIIKCRFAKTGEEYLVVGVGIDQQMLPKRCQRGEVRVYRVGGEVGERLELVHSTHVAAAPLAMAEFDGMLLCGIENELVVYDLGTRQLLRQKRLALPISTITALDVYQEVYIVVGDMRHSVTWVVHKPGVGDPNKSLVPFADDTVARHVTCQVALDSATVMCGDRFGNLFMLAVDEGAAELATEDTQAVMLRNETATLNAATAHRPVLETHYFVNDTPTSMTTASLVTGGDEAVVWAGLQGTIGAVIPLRSKQDATFFQTLETVLRDELRLERLGRDHAAFRGYYAPVKQTIDGDLCEKFGSLSTETQEYIAGRLGDRTVRDIERKIADMRIRSVF